MTRLTPLFVLFLSLVACTAPQLGERQVEIQGRLRNKDNAPIADVQIQAFRRDQNKNFVSTVKTDQEGRFKTTIRYPYGGGFVFFPPSFIFRDFYRPPAFALQFNEPCPRSILVTSTPGVLRGSLTGIGRDGAGDYLRLTNELQFKGDLIRPSYEAQNFSAFVDIIADLPSFCAAPTQTWLERRTYTRFDAGDIDVGFSAAMPRLFYGSGVSSENKNPAGTIDMRHFVSRKIGTFVSVSYQEIYLAEGQDPLLRSVQDVAVAFGPVFRYAIWDRFSMNHEVGFAIHDYQYRVVVSNERKHEMELTLDQRFSVAWMFDSRLAVDGDQRYFALELGLGYRFAPFTKLETVPLAYHEISPFLGLRREMF